MNDKKREYDLKRKIREMEAAKRNEAMASVETVVIIEKPVPVSFDHWWVVMNSKKQLRPHMKEIVWADFKARKLSKEELSSKYDEAMILFGL